MYRVALVVATLALASSALAQTPAAAAIDASNCPKPDDHPGRLASDRQRTGWEKEVQAWQECMKKYVGEVQAKADQAVKVANAAVAESNAVVAEYNNTVKTIQAQVDAAAK
jgi:hypothetical protein